MKPVIANTALYCPNSSFSQKNHFEVGRRLYLHNQLGALKKPCKLSLRMSVLNYVRVVLLQM